jgi:galactosamine-6-phosphate isomerase
MKPDRDSLTLRIEVADSYEAMSRRAAGLIVEELKKKPGLILSVAAGGSPSRLYELLADRHRLKPALFRRMRLLQIDEWGGLSKGHAASCESDLRLKFLEPLAVTEERYVGFRTEAKDPEVECDRIAQWLAANGPIDICILGLGLNGHVAMNEPAEALAPHAHVARLTRSSMQHPMLKQLRQKPSYGLTVGMGDILRSRMVLLLVNGKHKRSALERLLKPAITTRFPASLLWLHPQAIVLCDQEAAEGTRHADKTLTDNHL